MGTDASNNKIFPNRFFVPSLVLAFFSTWIIEALTGIFLKDISITFFGSSDPVSIASAGQLVTLSSIVSVIFGVLLGVLSVRFSPKKLLLTGIFGVILGILGCFFAPNFLFMQFFFPIEGIGTVIVSSMTFTLIGEFLILSRRPKATGWIIAGGPLSGILGALIITFFFTGADSWRSFLLWYALPVASIAFIVAYFFVPSSSAIAKSLGKDAYLKSFKQVLLKKSALGCLIGNFFRQAGFAWAVVFSITFFREQLGLSLSEGALIALVSNVIVVFASVVGGHLINLVGRKRLLVSTLAVSAPFLIIFAFSPGLLLALPVYFFGAFIYGMGFPGSVNLTLEQTPEFRGTMMSISTIFITLGLGSGTFVGGIALAFLGWVGLVVCFALIQFLAAGVYFFFTIDPCKN